MYGISVIFFRFFQEAQRAVDPGQGVAGKRLNKFYIIFIITLKATHQHKGFLIIKKLNC